MDQNTLGASSNKVVPLLQQMGRLEELTSALAMRLDPIINHEPTDSQTTTSELRTVTARLSSAGDALQYLLDHIEL